MFRELNEFQFLQEWKWKLSGRGKETPQNLELSQGSDDEKVQRRGVLWLCVCILLHVSGRDHCVSQFHSRLLVVQLYVVAFVVVHDRAWQQLCTGSG